MNVLSASSRTTTSSDVKKKVFVLKQPRQDGLILQIHHTVPVQSAFRRIRFLYSTFDKTGLILANADIDGNVFIIDFASCQFWSLPKFHSCSVLAFSSCKFEELIVGTQDGRLYLINIHLGNKIGTLEGHKNAVKSICFAKHQCLTASLYEAIIFDLNTLTKIHELTLDNETFLKHVSYMPVTNNILACFSDDYIHVWRFNNFESYKQILPTDWKKINIKSIAFTRNGTSMILAGHTSTLIIFSLDTWTLTKILNLPPGINSVKTIQFISREHDGGANKYLIILSNAGVIYFLDMENETVIGLIQKDSEIINFTLSINGAYLACVMHSGEINVYKINKYIEPQIIPCTECTNIKEKKKLKIYFSPQKPICDPESFKLNKLQGILKEYGEYPEAYRSLIWAKILKLPNNKQYYSAIIKNSLNTDLREIDEKYPLINKTSLKNLKGLLSNLASWCPVFNNIDFLPLFVFPFLKIFENDPLVCFEAIITIIINWCQHWFEYIPCAPINVLAMIENIFVLQDAQLLIYLSSNSITSHLYAWPLLENAFSEVLPIKEWCILWDHILSNEPSFILMAVVAYNILCRTSLLSLTTREHFETFYHSQNPINIKRLISKTYYLLKHTNEQTHPRQYMNFFQQLPEGSYPIFDDYPKIAVEAEQKNMKFSKENEEKLKQLETQISKYVQSEEKQRQELLMQEENDRRLQKLEDMYQEKIAKESERITQQRILLSRLQTQLHEKQAESLQKSFKNIEKINTSKQNRDLKNKISSIETSTAFAELEIQETEEALSEHYKELLKQKISLENYLVNDANATDSTSTEKSKRINKKTRRGKRVSITKPKEKKQNILKMKERTKSLENEVERLLELFKKAKIDEVKIILTQLAQVIQAKKEILEQEKAKLLNTN